MKRVVSLSAAILFVFLVGITVYPPWLVGQKAPVPAAPVNDASQAVTAVNIVRAINTAEVVTCRSKGGNQDRSAHFLPWNGLRNAPCLKKAQSHYWGKRFGDVSSLSFSPGPEISRGLLLHLVVSADGQHYNVWLGQRPEVHCGFVFFSDERGVIYEGKAIGCDSQTQPGMP
ncbi:MAG TPA: hypothetical protein VFZ27_05405 [Terriglobia bacterium]|nr:hypothetical protein [Terriglobia bacterium]